MKLSIRKLRLAWKFRRFRPVWKRRREIGAGALTVAALGAGIFFKSRGIKQLSEARH
jgi:hypothetical protein